MDDPKAYENSIQAHYGRANLSESLFAALQKAGKEITSYRDSAAFDEFHMRGRDATRELADLAGLHSGMKVLDLGCGLGGPSRLLASEFGCSVTGIDLIDDFIQAAILLTRKVGLENKVAFQKCNMLDLPFRENRFDAAWSQHTLMNIEDKTRLLTGVYRVLRPQGLLVLYEILAGSQAPIYYPVQWASDAAISFLLPEDKLLNILDAAGFEIVQWQDTTILCLQWFQAVVDKMAHRPKHAPAPLGLNLVIGPTAAEKARNTARNLEQDRIRVVYGVLRKKNE